MQNIENFGIWNIQKKIEKQPKYWKFWNMEYSIGYSWNIKKNIYKTGA